MKNKVYILLDRSGSMATMWNTTIASINGYVKEIGDADVMLATFDSTSYDVIRNTNTKKWKDVSPEEVTPRNMTPLLDASGRIMWNMIDSKADRAVLVVLTDGQENYSKKFSASEIKSMTKHLTEVLKYEMVFIGANFDGIADVAAKNFGNADTSRYINTNINNMSSTMNATAHSTTAYLSSGVRSATFYSTDDQAKATS